MPHLIISVRSSIYKKRFSDVRSKTLEKDTMYQCMYGNDHGYSLGRQYL